VAIDGPVTHNLELSLSGGRESVRNATVATAIGSFARILRTRTQEGG
jgi:nicotinamide-nucleotide amidase